MLFTEVGFGFSSLLLSNMNRPYSHSGEMCSNNTPFFDMQRVFNFLTVLLQMFFDICEGKLTLTNTGNSSFTCNVVCDEDTDSPEPGWLSVTPRNKYMVPGKSYTLLVKYFPGVTGYFSKKFTVEVRINKHKPVIDVDV